MSKDIPVQRVIGTPVNQAGDEGTEVFDDAGGNPVPGMDWRLSNETLTLMDEIEDNMRRAKRMADVVLFD